MFDQLSKIGKQIGGDLNKALHIPLKPDAWSIGSKPPTLKADATKLLTPASLVAEHDEDKEAVLQGLEAKYYQQDFEPLLYELSNLPVNFDTQTLEDTAEARTGVLEVVSELLSRHVLLNYDKFVEGITEVGLVEDDLQAAYAGTKAARELLALVKTDVQINIKVAKQTRRKHAYVRLLEVLLKLQQTYSLHTALKAAQENGDFAEAFWLCSECSASMNSLRQLKVSTQLTQTIQDLHDETSLRLHNALQVSCTDFRPEPYSKVLQGFMFLGHVGELGGEVASAFTNSINATVVQVVQGMLLTRSGFEERVKATSNMQEMLKWLPSDLFRTCLARVFMVVFDIMVSHFNMTRWHESGLAQHKGDLAAVQAAKLACKQRLLQQSPQLPAPASHTNVPPRPADGQQAPSSGNTFLDNNKQSMQPHMPEAAPDPTCNVRSETDETRPPNASHNGGAAQSILESMARAGCTGAQMSAGAISASSSRGAAAQPSATDSHRPSSSPALPPGTPIGPILSQQAQLNKPQAISSAPQPGTPPDPEASIPSGQVQPMSESTTTPQPTGLPRGQPYGPTAASLGQKQQPASVPAKMTVRFDSQVPASPPKAAAAASQQQHPVRHAGQHSAHAAGERVQAGQSGEVRDDQQQWRVELEALQVQEREEMEWGEVLHVVHSGLVASRRLLWDESERKVIALLSSSSAFEGDHFLQVLEWAQRILSAGEAFSGVECVSLRSMLAAQSSNFFTAYHSGNLEALHSMLEKELWRRLPSLPEGIPSLQHALRNPSQSGSLASSGPAQEGAKPFEIIAAGGNPWKQRRRRSPKRDQASAPSGPFRLGFAGSSMLQEDRASMRLEVDDHGLPRRVSTDIWSAATSKSPSRAVSTTTSRRTSRDTDVANTPGPLLSESEASELFGDYIDEDSQTVQHDMEAGASSSPNLTNSSHKLMRWLRDYGELMRILRPAPFAYRGMCELFEMFLLMTFNTFSEVSIACLLDEQLPQGYGGNAVANRLRKTLIRIVNQSLTQYKPAVVSSRPVHALGSQQGIPSSSNA